MHTLVKWISLITVWLQLHCTTTCEHIQVELTDDFIIYGVFKGIRRQLSKQLTFKNHLNTHTHLTGLWNKLHSVKSHKVYNKTELETHLA